MIEVKPAHETKAPTARKKSARGNRRFIAESLTFARNQAKWAAARMYCAKRGWTFAVMSEKDILGA